MGQYTVGLFGLHVLPNRQQLTAVIAIVVIPV